METECAGRNTLGKSESRRREPSRVALSFILTLDGLLTEDVPPVRVEG